MTIPLGAVAGGYIVDNMVLAMFVDSGYAELLTALAANKLFVSPAIIDSAATPPFDSLPSAEFAQGAFFFQEQQGNPRSAVRFNRRMAFYLDVSRTWNPVALTIEELQLQEVFAAPATWDEVRLRKPTRRGARIGRGEAECAAVAVTRGWTLWSDDAPIVNLLGALYPGHQIERISDLLMRAAHEGLIGCQEAADLYNDVFKGTLGLWTSLTLVCRSGQVVIQ